MHGLCDLPGRVTGSCAGGEVNVPSHLSESDRSLPQFSHMGWPKMLDGEIRLLQDGKKQIKALLSSPHMEIDQPRFSADQAAIRTSLAKRISSSFVRWEQRWSEMATLTPSTSLIKAMSFRSPVKVMLGYS